MPLQVLLFEPDKRLAGLFESIIQQAAPDADLHRVASTYEALRIAGTASPDVFVLDHEMVKDARSLLNDFRTYHPLARILLVVPAALPEGFEASVRSGSVHFLAKPVAADQAVKVLAWLLNPGGVSKEYFYQAHLRDSSLIEILQMKIQGGFTTLLDVFNSDGPKGQIVVDRGRIAHAATDALEGDAAFRQILEWNGGLIIEQPAPAPVPQTIRQETRNLLLEAARMLDRKMQTAAPAPPAAAESPASPPVAAPGTAPAPAAEIPPSPAVAPEEPVPPEPGRAVTVGGVKEEELSRFMALPKILVIDDDPRILHMAEEILGHAWPSHAIIGVETGSEGFECAQLYRPQVVLLDYVLPDFNGDDFAAKMRTHPDLSGIPIVLMSGFANEIRTAALNHVNVIGTLSKPFVTAELTALVKKAIELPPPPLHPEVERSLRYAGSLTSRILRHHHPGGARYTTPVVDDSG